MPQTNHYLFDTSTGFNDSTGSLNYNGSLPQTGEIVGSGKINECLSFFVNGYGVAATGGAAVATFSSPTTVAMWIKSSNDGSVELITNGYTKVSIDISASATLSVTNGASFEFFITLIGFDLTPNAWNHIVIINDGFTSWDFYCNGTYLGPSVALNNVSTMSMNSIGTGTGGSPTSFFVDDLRFYDEIIDSTEVAFIYNSGAGTQADSSTGAASGSLATITMSGPAGSASGAGGSGSASGGLSTITVSPISGSASAGTDVTASGPLSTITVSPFSGIAFPEFIAYGSLPTITVSTMEAIASTVATIQLEYIVCDGEITWTQTLPITGFSSAIQGQDAISSSVSPAIGPSDANIVFFEQRVVPASGTHTYDLTSLTDFLGGPLSLSRAYGICVTCSGGAGTLAPGASNPFQWFFASTTANISFASNGSFLFAQPNPATINSGSKTLVVTNTSGVSAMTYKIAILGGR